MDENSLIKTPTSPFDLKTHTGKTLSTVEDLKRMEIGLRVTKDRNGLCPRKGHPWGCLRRTSTEKKEEGCKKDGQGGDSGHRVLEIPKGARNFNERPTL